MLEQIKQWDNIGSARLRTTTQPGWWHNSASVFAHSGDSWFWLPGLAIVAILGDARWRYFALLLIGAILATAGVVFILKFSIRRQRPASEWGSFYRKTDPHSFPSGHAARAFVLATLGMIFAPLAWLGPVLVIWAVLVSLARVSLGVHYLSDILAGAVLGVCIGILCKLIGL
jgi:undecaprenyl-diphosphatase